MRKAAAAKLLLLKRRLDTAILFFDNFNEALSGNWDGATWSVSGGAALNTPVPGAELIVNGGFGADTDWTKGSDWTIAGGVGVRASGAGSTSITQAVLTTGGWYRCSFDIVAISASAMRPLFGAQHTEGQGATVATFLSSRLATGTTAGINATAGAMTGQIDNVSYKPLTLSELFATINANRANVAVSVALTLTDPSPHACGVVVNLDSTSSPANFVVAYAFRNGSGINMFMAKCVAGTYTQLENQSGTYVAGASLKVRKSGTTYQLFYNGVQVGLDRTVSDAGIISNTRHGMFSTHESNLLDNAMAVAV